MADGIVDGLKRLSAPVVADVLRFMGYLNQVMDPTILPFNEGWRVCGRAFTLANLPGRAGEPNVFAEAESKLQPGDVVVNSYLGSWGINYATGAMIKGCAGAVIDGAYRDIPAHKEELPDFPVFCRRGLSERSSNPGSSHRSFHTRWMYAYNVPVNCGGVRVDPGDIILGDDDGVVVVPKDIAETVLKFALEYEKFDSAVAKAKREGKSAAEANARKKRWVQECGLMEWFNRNVPGSILGSDYVG